MVILNDDYIVEIDGRNYTLKSKYQKKTEDDEGSEEFEFGTIGYYGNLKHAIKAAAEDTVRRKLTKEKYGLMEATEIINTTYREFSKLLNEKISDFNMNANENVKKSEPTKRGRKKKEQVE